jgi:iron complex outermembrane recepter protein
MQARKGLSAGLGVVVALCAQRALAQDSTAEVQEVIVTARRVQENIQDVPLAVTAFTSEKLRENSIRSTHDLMFLTPGVTLNYQGSTGNPTFTMRGISKSAVGPGLPSVVSYLNEVPLPNNGSVLPTFDMSSVQVLKGPQGTLFGRNTIGGAVLVYTEKPQFKWGGYIDGLVGNLGWRQAEGALNVPIIADKVALRVAGQVQRRDGYTRDPVNGDANDLHRQSVRVSLLIRPSEELENTTVYDQFSANEVGSGSGGVLYGVLPTGSIRSPALAPFFNCGTSASCDIDLFLAEQQQRGTRNTTRSIPGLNKLRVSGVSNTTMLDLGGVHLKNIFGYRRTTAISVNDSDATPFRLVTAFSETRLQQYSDEIQATGKLFNDRVSWLVGGFYLKGMPYGPQTLGLELLRPPSAALSYNNSSAYLREQSKALFGQVSVNLGGLIDGLGVDAGYRYTWDELSGCSISTPSSVPIVPSSDCVARGGITGSVNSKAPTWTLALNYKPTEDVLAYVTTRRGYRGGGFNTPQFSPVLASVQTFTPETLTDVEVGLKATWRKAEWRGHFNIAAYRSTYKDIQSIVRLAANFDGDGNPANDPTGAQLLANLADAKIKGVEIDASISPSRRFTLSGVFSYIDPKYTAVSLPQSIANVPSALAPFVYTSRYTYGFNARYVLPLRNDMGELALTGTYYWADNQVIGDNLITPKYDLIDLRLDWNHVAGKSIDLSAFVRNALDSKYVTASTVASAALGFYTALYGEPRTYGLEARYRFGN